MIERTSGNRKNNMNLSKNARTKMAKVMLWQHPNTQSYEERTMYDEYGIAMQALVMAQPAKGKSKDSKGKGKGTSGTSVPPGHCWYHVNKKDGCIKGDACDKVHQGAAGRGFKPRKNEDPTATTCASFVNITQLIDSIIGELSEIIGKIVRDVARVSIAENKPPVFV